MTDTTKALFFKFLMTFIIAWIAFGLLDNNPFSWILAFAILGTVVNYLAGDLLVLRGLGNVVGAIGDAAMSVLLAYILDILSFNFDTTVNSLAVLGILVAIGEYFFHQYLLSNDDVTP